VNFNQRLVELALKYEPKIRLMQQQIKQAEASVELTRRQRLPDVNVGLEARNYTGDGSFRQGMLVFSMNLPWANSRKYRSEIKREESKLKATEFNLADYQAGLREEVHQLTIRIDAARREALLYRDEILPRTQAALESTRAEWESNRGSIRDLLDARRLLLEARLSYVRAVATQYEMLSDLVLCCGLGDLGALQMIAAEPETNAVVDPTK
jgi:outer membrane protein TolC